MSSCKKCDKYNPFSVFSFLRTTARKKSFSNNNSGSLKKLRKTLKLKGGWKKKPKK